MVGQSREELIRQYGESHQHPLNRLTHFFGIPMIALSIPLLAASFFWRGLLWPALALFVGGWVLQFIGHAFEGKPPEFLKNWRFLFVGLAWWARKMRALFAGGG